MKPLSYIDLSHVTDETAPALKEHVIAKTYGNTWYQNLLIPLLNYYENKIQELLKETKNAKTN